MSYRSESNNKWAGAANSQPIKSELQQAKSPDSAPGFLCTLCLSAETYLVMFAKASRTITIARMWSFEQTPNPFKY